MRGKKFNQVFCKDELPTKSGDYHANSGPCYFDKDLEKWTLAKFLVKDEKFIDIVWWLEDVTPRKAKNIPLKERMLSREISFTDRAICRNPKTSTPRDLSQKISRIIDLFMFDQRLTTDFDLTEEFLREFHSAAMDGAGLMYHLMTKPEFLKEALEAINNNSDLCRKYLI